MDKILGIDLGTNSIGWALRNPDLAANQIEKFGVLTFNKGVGIGKSGEYSFAGERTKKRSTRRLYQSRKYRLWATLEVLIKQGYCPLSLENLNRWRHYSKAEAVKNNNGGRVYPVDDIAFDQWIKLDFNGDGKQDYTSPYQLRKQLAETFVDFNNETNRFKLGRALYHIAQRRGFKSSRKATGDDDKPKENENDEVVELQYSEKKKTKKLLEKFPDFAGCATVGVFLANKESEGERVRLEITQYLVRENYKDEIKFIFNFQQLGLSHPLYKEIVESSNNKNDGSIFYKRPLRSQKGLIGKCTLETNKYRAPISHPKFELFRAWCFLNNIKYKPTNDSNPHWQALELGLKQEILADKFFRKSKAYFPFSEIAEYIAKKGYKWQLNYSPKTTVSGCPLSARLKDIFGDDYLNVRIAKDKAPKADKAYYDIEDIWHILFSCEDQEFVAEFAAEKLKLSPENVKQFVIAWNALPVGYGMLSLNAITKINRFLEKGLIYTEAVLLANLPEVIGEQLWKENEELFLNTISKLIEENRKQKNILSVVNNLVARYKSLDQKFGHKDDNYKLASSDHTEIQKAIVESFGANRWEEKTDEGKTEITSVVTDCYQAFFRTTGLELRFIRGDKYFEVRSGNNIYLKTETGFYRLPKLIDTLADFVTANLSHVTEKQLKKIYHPSEINIYPPAKEDKDGIIKLGSPQTGSFKNPMAMRTLHELRKLMNYLIESSQIDNHTKVVVEVARELNDANKRWAIEAWQRQREAENQEFAQAIAQLLKDEKGVKANPQSADDIDKVRLFYEQNDEQTLPAVLDEEAQGKKKKAAEKDEAVRWNGHGKKLIDKYRLWVEQGYQCIYTGKFIKLTDLFSDNVIDIEHTIPRSVSFDNSLANQTVCFADYNRNVKKKQLPTQLSNYEKDFGGYTAIVSRLDKWREKVERIKQQIDFWKTKSKKAADKNWKDDAIRQRHLWQMEFDYWKNKLDRFTIQEVTTGFKNSQKTDTQLISKYALHYMKTFFEKVDMQKGSITAEFRKIYGLQVPNEKKDRSKHSHHAKDAAVLTLIPASGKRDEILTTYYEHRERNETYTTEPYKGFKHEFVWGIDDSVLINNIAKDQSLTPAKKKVRKRGKEVFVPGTNKRMWATGDSIRGQLHQETFYGAIKPAKRGEKGNIEKDDNGKMILEEKLRYVVRVPFQYKKDANTPGFKTLEEIHKQIVDEGLKVQIAQQVGEAGGLKEAFEKGIYLLDKNGKPHGNKIRHIRVWASVADPLEIKMQTNLSTKDYKQKYYAANGENLICALYQKTVKNKKTGEEKMDRQLEIVSLKDAADWLKTEQISKTEDLQTKLYRKNNKGEKVADENGNEERPYVLLKPSVKVIFYDDQIDVLKKRKDENETDYKKRISYSMYKVVKFTGGRLTFLHHLEARNDRELDEAYPEKQYFKTDEKGKEVSYGGRGTSGFTEKVSDAKRYNAYNNFEPWPKLLYSADWLNMAIEGKHFEIERDGQIKWLL